MSLITPVGNSNFQWSPKDKDMVKTASTGEDIYDDKDALVEAARKVVEAQGFGEEVIEDVVLDNDPEEEVVIDLEPSDETEDIIEDAEGLEEEGGVGDVAEAVAELVEKADEAEAVAEAVTDALEKVEEAVQDVKSAVGNCDGEECDGEAEGLSDVIEDISDEVSDDAEECDEPPCDDDDDEIIQESGEGCVASEEVEVKTAGTDENRFVSLAKISPSTRKKVYTYWTKFLKYPADYSKLLVKDHE